MTLNTINNTLICPNCNGDGEIEVIHHYGLTGMQCEITVDCDDCNGTGEIEATDEG